MSATPKSRLPMPTPVAPVKVPSAWSVGVPTPANSQPACTPIVRTETVVVWVAPTGVTNRSSVFEKAKSPPAVRKPSIVSFAPCANSWNDAPCRSIAVPPTDAVV
jgi:hypothetical protein